MAEFYELFLGWLFFEDIPARMKENPRGKGYFCFQFFYGIIFFLKILKGFFFFESEKSEF